MVLQDDKNNLIAREVSFELGVGVVAGGKEDRVEITAENQAPCARDTPVYVLVDTGVDTTSVITFAPIS